jgi:hypothetical protein
MPSESTAAPEMIGELAVKLAGLPAEDLQLVAEFVSVLEGNRSEAPKPVSVKKIREEAKRRAHLLREVPREQLIGRFLEIGEQIRQEAISRGSAIEGDWTGD